MTMRKSYVHVLNVDYNKDIYIYDWQSGYVNTMHVTNELLIKYTWIDKTRSSDYKKLEKGLPKSLLSTFW